MRLRNRHLLLLIISILFIVSCGINTSGITEVEIVNPTTGEKNTIMNNAETAKLIVSAVKKNEKVDLDISKLPSFEIYINKDSKNDGYTMSFDVENRSVYLSKDNYLYKVKDSIAKDLLLDDNFSFAYITKSMNKIYIYNKGELIKPSIQYDWNYKNINDEYKNKTGTLLESSDKIVVSKNDNIDIKFDINPSTQITRLYSEGNVINTSKSILDAINSIQYDGEYFIESEFRWNQKDNSSYGSQTVSFMAQVDIPADFKIITKDNYPGNILIISVENMNEGETVKLQTDIVKTQIDIFPYKDKYMLILPIDLYTKLGDYDVNVIFNEGKATEYTNTKILNIKNKEFKVQYLTVSEELNSNNNDYKAIQEFAQYVKPARTESSSKKLWDGQFIMPVEGKLTTDFAEIRYVNDELSSSRHSGIDLAAPRGTDIKAPNNGKVTLAMNGLLSTGNTLVIDHGMGLFTSYYHLDSISVKEGDVVEKGSIVGKVGSTGFSTGPHLHYAVSIYNTYVNTYQILNGIFD
ncbi:murein DD-endopeptidase MepM/ murein hydrolase activator NlpD [Sedimentibacter acidaminivorans]|jgi:murein DD-endopeptidase MepM/ murein hydrolase activator NlpD|uniref:Murein DD-endopeptidase MepM/ murein hydrolase activator NlpD n=1 Tax=Sedimentibacter acidaminivorans TaxID=913099 RepID=A0ABS4GEW9_9FIRM|nr:M23 family metallopeptidase [Sedimentibacter acidaminivorans]MBP1926245.1 murein DD-endopeptidase MepM/ murein hydrolase activator NlpD [Sedimentibacter acidaminivorans]